VIPGGFYRGTDADIESFGVRATLLTTTATSDEVVYEMVKAVFANFDRLKELHPALAQLDREEMVKASLSAPLHPGAERYYREAGLM
jgi:TRAP transporter TAXI family solute receptor